MADSKDNSFIEALKTRADVVVSDADHVGGLNTAEILAWREWFNERARELRSSGGRPTNPHWSMKRQIALTTESWDALNDMAAACSRPGAKLAAGQMAAFLLEDAITFRVAHGASEATTSGGEFRPAIDFPEDPRFREWSMPELFSGRAA